MSFDNSTVVLVGMVLSVLGYLVRNSYENQSKTNEKVLAEITKLDKSVSLIEQKLDNTVVGHEQQVADLKEQISEFENKNFKLSTRVADLELQVKLLADKIIIK